MSIMHLSFRDQQHLLKLLSLYTDPLMEIVVLRISEISSDKFFTVPGKLSLGISVITAKKKLTLQTGNWAYSYRTLLKKKPFSRRNSPFED